MSESDFRLSNLDIPEEKKNVNEEPQFIPMTFDSGTGILQHDTVEGIVDEAREKVLKACKMLVDEGLVARTWGNISARINDELFAITPSGKAYDTLTPDQIVVVRASDCTWMGDIKPSSEKGIHASIYLDRPEVNMVIHTHQFYASAISIIGLDVENVSELSSEAGELVGDRIPCAGYGLSSTDKLRNNVRKAFADNPGSKAVLMRNHGAVCVGEDIDSAFHASRLLEEVSKKLYSRYCLGDVADEPAGESRMYVEGDTSAPSWARKAMINGNKCVVLSKEPYTVKVSRQGMAIRPYIDDLAQIGGVNIKCVMPEGSTSELKKALRNSDAVLVKGAGAICAGKEPDDAEALATVLEKGCAAAHLAASFGDVKPVSRKDALFEREVYVTKYSRLKKTGDDKNNKASDWTGKIKSLLKGLKKVK